MAKRKLKAPFPIIGGKGRVADLIWGRLGDVENFCEPFMGSAAVLLARRTTPRIETVNDINAFLANFYRAVAADPDAVARHADWPVSEVDLRARHLWLLCSDTGIEFQKRMKLDPDYYDAKIGGWWAWGQSCWIGADWCAPAAVKWNQVPHMDGNRGVLGAPGERRPQLHTGTSEYGRGVHGMAGAPGEKRPLLSGRSPRDDAHGVNRGPKSDGRPNLADAYAKGRGVNANDAAGTCDQRRAWLTDWMRRLADRFRTVRTCCGSWERVCSSPSVTTRLGTTGVFLDPPYAHSIERMHAWVLHLDGKGEPPEVTGDTSNRDGNLYASDLAGDTDRLVADVFRYARLWGKKPGMRIVLAGYAGEHDALEDLGWTSIKWKGSGYGNRTAQGKDNAAKETLWISPNCRDPEREDRPLFQLLHEDA